MTRIKVYSKLSLDRKQILEVLPQAEVASPIKRGDISSDIQSGYQVLLIIDGQFHHSLAVSADEIRDAIHSGLRVYGASSMGALRASELYQYGMIGHGKIFEFIRANPYFRDDFLGQVFYEDEKSIRVLSFTYVDFYFNLQELLKKKKTSSKTVKTLLAFYAELFYSDRSWLFLKKKIMEFADGKEELLKVADWAINKMGSQKSRDGLSLCQKVREDLEKVKNLNAQICPAKFLRHQHPVVN